MAQNPYHVDERLLSPRPPDRDIMPVRAAVDLLHNLAAAAAEVAERAEMKLSPVLSQTAFAEPGEVLAVLEDASPLAVELTEIGQRLNDAISRLSRAADRVEL